MVWVSTYSFIFLDLVPINFPYVKFLLFVLVQVRSKSPNPAKLSIVLGSPPKAFINSFISCYDSVINIACVDSLEPKPLSIPAAIAITFLIEPHT